MAEVGVDETILAGEIVGMYICWPFLHGHGGGVYALTVINAILLSFLMRNLKNKMLVLRSCVTRGILPVLWAAPFTHTRGHFINIGYAEAQRHQSIGKHDDNWLQIRAFC